MKLVFLSLILIFPIVTQAQDHLNPCLKSQAFHIVVLGSSTAAGTGPSSQDSAWVWRYRSYLKEINPQNQVTNLAVGGTTTYHILPDGTPVPTGRPAPTPNNNISQAISLGADAIIVNMPSNDAALGYSFQETMSNFHLLDSTAAALGIPIWICTTQPRTFSQAKASIQVQIKDSVLAAFGPFAIDFWTGFADSSNQVLATFDSGDGVHLNDSAHSILFERVRQKQILSTMYLEAPSPDVSVIDLQAVSNPNCGTSAFEVQAILINTGDSIYTGFPVQWQISSPIFSTVRDTMTSSGLSPCETDTLSIILDLRAGGEVNIALLTMAAGDTFPSNDLLLRSFSLLPMPEVQVHHDTVCTGEPAELNASLLGGDTLFWYDAPTGGLPLASGGLLPLSQVDSTETRYVQAVTGDLFFKQSLFTRQASNRTWNGVMFDIMAHADLSIDSLDIQAFSTGSGQVIDIYTKSGSHLGYEQNANAWSLWGSDTIEVVNSGEFQSVNMAGLPLNAGDTLGIYLTFQVAGNRLYYEAVPQPGTYSDGTISVYSGTGITHTFGQTYFPRDWAGEVYYHYGWNLEGDCAGPRVPVSAYVSEPVVNLGPDTVVSAGSPLLLDPGTFSTYLWFDASTAATYWFPTDTTPGSYLVWVGVMDQYGCVTSDSILVEVVSSNAIDPGHSELTLYPNPAQTWVTIKGLHNPVKLEVYDLHGRLIRVMEVTEGFSVSEWQSGTFLLMWKERHRTYRTLLQVLK